MLWLYRLIFVPLLLVAAPYYLWRMRRRGGYRDGFAQRFGAVPALPPRREGVRRIWLQAVSVGEMLAIGPVLEALARRPQTEIYLSTTTSTGYRLAGERYRALTIGIGYFPLDWWPLSARAWCQVEPDLAILTEGERWPEFIAQARRRGVPLVALNGRLSDRSFMRMKLAAGLVRPLMRGFTRVLACSEHDAARFRALGFPADTVVTTGNIKLDITPPLLAADEKNRLRAELGLREVVSSSEKTDTNRLVLLGSSTWPGEESALVEAYRQLRADGLCVRLLLVPRHAERRAELETMLATSGFSSHFRSRGAASAPVDIAVGDTTGELRQFTQLADLVFVGKSLPPHGEGQTPVEAAALGRPILFGPGMSNFRPIAAELVTVGGAEVVPAADALTTQVGALLRDETRRTAMAAAAKRWHQANQGAVVRSIAELETLLCTKHPEEAR